MATFKYFAEANGEAVELSHPYGLENKKFAEAFPGIRGKKYDGFSRWVGTDAEGKVHAVLRVIEYLSNPSKHKCDSRCLNAQGKTMKCQCSCNGKNHGRGQFVCE